MNLSANQTYTTLAAKPSQSPTVARAYPFLFGWCLTRLRPQIPASAAIGPSPQTPSKSAMIATTS